MTNKKWKERYKITGRLWKRGDLLKRAVNTAYGMCLNKLPHSVIRTEIARSLDNEAFMSARRGMASARVIDDLAYAAFFTLWPGVKHG